VMSHFVMGRFVMGRFICESEDMWAMHTARKEFDQTVKEKIRGEV
jgi:hypothetical protein